MGENSNKNAAQVLMKNIIDSQVPKKKENGTHGRTNTLDVEPSRQKQSNVIISKAHIVTTGLGDQRQQKRPSSKAKDQRQLHQLQPHSNLVS